MRLLLLSLLVALPCAAQGKKKSLHGRWVLELERPGWQPRVCHAALVLEKSGKKWTGSLGFEVILYGKKHGLKDVKVKGSRVEFALDNPQFAVAFEGTAKGGELSGTCEWQGVGKFPWTAKRAGAAAKVSRFNERLRFGAFLPKAKAEDLGLDGAALDELLGRAQKNGTSAVLVLKDGKVVAERYFGGPSRKTHLMSVTKFLAAMAIAFLIDEGKIETLDAPLSTWFPEWKEGVRGQVTLRHVMSHTSGIRHRKNARELNEQKDKVKYVRAAPVVDAPGTKFSYNNDAIALLSGVITAAAGRPVDTYLKEKLFRPLQIRDWAWDRDRAGNPLTYAQCLMHARDLAKIGLLIAQGGKWKGKQVFPEKWIATLGGKPGSGLSEACGLIWWRHKRGDEIAYYHTGYLGQFLVIYPESNLVGIRLRTWDGSEEANRSFSSFIALLDRLP